jgi:hypothetical protein
MCLDSFLFIIKIIIGVLPCDDMTCYPPSYETITFSEAGLMKLITKRELKCFWIWIRRRFLTESVNRHKLIFILKIFIEMLLSNLWMLQKSSFYVHLHSHIFQKPWTVSAIIFNDYTALLCVQQVNPLSGVCSGANACLTDLQSLSPLPHHLADVATTHYLNFNLRYLDNPNYYHPLLYSIQDGENFLYLLR